MQWDIWTSPLPFNTEMGVNGNLEERRKMKKMHLIITSSVLFSLVLSGCLDSKSEPKDEEKNEIDDNEIINEGDAQYDDTDTGEEQDLKIDKDYNPIISVNSNDIRTHTTYKFSIDDPPNNSNITWDFDDGIIMYGKIVSHRYTVSDYYTIKVEITWDSYSAESQLPVEVRNADTVTMLVSDINRIIVGSGGTGLGAEIQEGITIPKCHVYLNLSQLICDLNVTIGLYDTDNNEISTLISDSISSNKMSVNNYWFIPEEMIEPSNDNRPMFLKISIRCDDLVGHAVCEYRIILIY